MQIANTRTQVNSFVAASNKSKCCVTARNLTVCAQGAATERKVGSFGAISVQGTARKQNEDRYSLDVCFQLFYFSAIPSQVSNL
jgi:hypothetical protein